LVAIAFALSVALTVMEAALPDIVGVPEMAPPELNDNPAGNVPAVNTKYTERAASNSQGL